MQLARTSVGLPFLLLAFAGCLDGGLNVPDSDVPDTPAWLPDTEIVLPSGAEAHRFIQAFPMSHPYRFVASNDAAGQAAEPPSMQAARSYLATTLKGFGLGVEQQKYSASGTNIVAFHPGATTPREWVVLSCHYDSAESTVFGAWDDGAGCSALLEMARTFSTMTWNRTLVFAFFDEEESGLIGSNAFVTRYAKDPTVTLAANLNFDPPGLNYPCGDAQGKFPLQIGIPKAKAEGEKAKPGYPELMVAAQLAVKKLGVPEQHVTYATGVAVATVAGRGLTGTSDHARFDARDIPNAFIGGEPISTAGPASAMTYALHTPLDTLAQMEARCGSAELVKQALQTVLDLTHHMLVEYDGVAYEPAP